MKKAIILVLLALLPLPSFAANFAQTPFELLTEVKDNRKAILKIQQTNYCIEWPAKEQVELDKLNAISTKTEDITDRIEVILNNKSAYKTKCGEAERGLLAWDSYKVPTNSTLTCGSSYIKRGELCLTPTEVCQFYFGKNVSGQDDITAIDTATCVCDEGYELNANKCVLKVKPQVASASSASPTNAELQAILNQLLAQVMSLIKQLNALQGR